MGLARLVRRDLDADASGVRWLVPDENLVLTSVAATLLVYRRSLWFMFVKNPEYLLHVASLVLIRRFAHLFWNGGSSKVPSFSLTQRKATLHNL